jgi:hypothetical protein
MTKFRIPNMLMESMNKKTNLTLSELYQKFKKIKKDIWNADIRIQSERVQVIKERLHHYQSTGNTRKTDIYQRKLDEIKIKV